MWPPVVRLPLDPPWRHFFLRFLRFFPIFVVFFVLLFSPVVRPFLQNCALRASHFFTWIKGNSCSERYFEDIIFCVIFLFFWWFLLIFCVGLLCFFFARFNVIFRVLHAKMGLVPATFGVFLSPLGVFFAIFSSFCLLFEVPFFGTFSTLAGYL